MTPDVRPLTPDDLPELGRFLGEGFSAPAGSAFAAADVLRWKYLDPRGVDAGDAPRSFLAVEPGTGRVVGHVGVCPGRFRGGGIASGGVSTLHMIDWLGSESARGVGSALMRRAHRGARTQYVLVASPAARRVLDRAGYQRAADVPVYRNVLRPGYRLRVPGPSAAGRALRAAKDAAGKLTRPARVPRVEVEARPVEAFGPEVGPILAAYEARAVFSTRGADLLNHILRYPRGGVSGWHLVRRGSVCGVALLSVVPTAGAVREGRIVECLLGDPDADAWHASAVALTAELGRQGADLSVALGSTPWSALALRQSGYVPAYALEFRLRDRDRMLSPGSVFHLTPLEADSAYT